MQKIDFNNPNWQAQAAQQVLRVVQLETSQRTAYDIFLNNERIHSDLLPHDPLVALTLRIAEAIPQSLATVADQARGRSALRQRIATP